MTNITFGSDPELMLVDLDGNYKSAIGVIPGTKTDKISLGNGHFAFYDNVLAEVNIAPSGSAQEAVSKFQDCFQRLAKIVGTKIRLLPQASQTYPKKECEHEDAKIFGCDPEYCIYLRSEEGFVLKVDPPIVRNTFRSGGGHIHIGHELALPWHDPIAVVQMMDIFPGIMSVLLDHDPTSLARREIYGGAGSHRVCMEYGLEYRCLSNFWVAQPELVSFMYDLTNLVMKMISEKTHEKVFKEVDLTMIPKIINGNLKAEAKKVFKGIESYLPAKLKKQFSTLVDRKAVSFYTAWNIKAT